MCVRLCPFNTLVQRNYTLSITGTQTTAISNALTPLRSREAKIAWSSGVLSIFGGSANANESAAVADTFAIMRHNLPSSATVRLYLYSDNLVYTGAQFATQIYDSGALPANSANPATINGRSDFMLKLASPATFKSFKLEFGGLAATGSTTIANIYFGQSIALTNGASEGVQYQQINAAEYARSAGGGLITKSPAIFGRSLSLPFAFMTDVERNLIGQNERNYRNETWLVCGYPDSTMAWQLAETTFLGRLDGAATYTRSATRVRHGASLTIREI